MKKMKRLLAVLLALAMVLGMTVMTSAGSVKASQAQPAGSMQKSSGSKPQPSDTAQAVVANVASGAAVTAYRIVEPTYSSNGFTGYRAADGTAIANALEPTSDEVTSIAANKALLSTLTSRQLYATGPVYANGLTTYTAQLGAGYWLVVVTPLGLDVTQIYNPMLIGVYYSVDGTGSSSTLVSGGTVDATSNWSLNSTPAYAKSEKPTIDKKITNSDRNESGNDVATGDTVSFEIETQIPAYSKAYKNVKVAISDRIGKGLSLVSPAGIVVRLGAASSQAAEVPGSAYTYSPDYDNKGFTLTFTPDFALEHSGEKVFIAYDAVLGGDAGINFDANTNTAVLEYTNDANGNTTRIEDRTYIYTFGIDTSLYGQSGADWNIITQELIKTGDPAQITSGSAIKSSALSGAAFTLTGTGSTAGKVYTAVSDAEGHLSFTGLDAGTYDLQETSAPEGYSLNDSVIPVEITAAYNQDGTLGSYTITVAGEAVSTYTAMYYTNGQTKAPEITNISSSVTTYEIKNTRLSGLPSTGGIGTTIFTIVGCAIMILAAALFFASRRKSAK